MHSERKLSQSSSVSSPLRSEGYSTYSPSIRHKSIDDGDLYIAGQGLVPVVNNPGLHSSNSGSFGGLLSWPASAVDKAWTEASFGYMGSLRKEISLTDFAEYRQRLGETVEKYLTKRISIKQEDARKLNASDSDGCGYLRGEGLVQALRQVPSLYFQEDFSLTRPDTFSQVIRGETNEERSSILETLNGYLDVVETELLNEIAARSDSFFEAAESLQDLQKSMGNTLFQIQRLQVHAHTLDGGMCARAGQIQTLDQQKKNLEDTLKVLQIVESMTHAQETVNLLLLAHDYPSCLQLIDDLQLQYDSNSKEGLKSNAIKKILCLKHIPDALDASVIRLNGCLVGELLEILNWDKAEGILRTVAARALGEEARMGIASLKDSNIVDYQGKKEKLKQIFIGLSRTGSLSESFAQVIPHIVAKLNSSIRNLSEILLPNFVHMATNSATIQDTGINGHLQHITHDMFLTLLDSCLAVEESCISHFAQLGTIIMEATDAPSLIHQSSLVDHGKNDMCQALVDTCHNHWIELFSARAQVHHKLTLDQIQELKTKNAKCEDLVKKAGARNLHKLDNLLQAQCKSAIFNVHHQSYYEMQQALEHECWTLVQVPVFFQQQLMNQFFDTVTEDTTLDSTDEKQECLVLENANFHVVNSALCLLSSLCRYIQNNNRFPEFVTDIGRHSIELLSLFNTRSCQLILGAQAMRVNSLKSITAKHLALCSQSILLMMHLQTPLTEALLKGCPASKRTILQPEFDRVKQDLSTHLEGIHSKLVGIMEERLRTGVQQMKDLFFSLQEATDIEKEAKPSQAAQTIGKQLRILTQVLTPLLHEEQLHNIFNRVIRSFVHVLEVVFTDMSIELKLINPEDGQPSTEEAATPHPLDVQSFVEGSTISRQREQASVDCLFLNEILAKLPASEDINTVMGPLTQISTLLDPCSSSI